MKSGNERVNEENNREKERKKRSKRRVMVWRSNKRWRKWRETKTDMKRKTGWMTCSEMECLTYKYSLIAVILVPIICTLSMSLLVPLASVPTTINNSVRFSVELLSTFVLFLLFLIIIIIIIFLYYYYYYYYPVRAWQKLHNCEARIKTPKEHGRPSDQRNMDREHFVHFVHSVFFSFSFRSTS